MVGVRGVAEAKQDGFLPLPVCVRPPDVDKSIILWSYWAGGHTQVRKNLDGPDAALVQAFASITMIAAVVLSPPAEAFEKKLKDAGAKGTRLLMKDMEKVGEGVAEELAQKEVQEIEQKIVQKGGEPLNASAKLQAEKFARAN